MRVTLTVSDTAFVFKVVVYFFNDMATQTNQIQTFITQKMDAIICNLVQTSSAEAIVNLCVDADSPLVLINREPPGDEKNEDGSIVDESAKIILDNPKVCYVYSDNTIDGQSRKKAYTLFESGLLNSLEPGSIKCLQQIHAYLFGGLYEFAGQIRNKNISKGGFTFANCLHFPTIIPTIERMPETTLDEIADKRHGSM